METLGIFSKLFKALKLKKSLHVWHALFHIPYQDLTQQIKKWDSEKILGCAEVSVWGQEEEESFIHSRKNFPSVRPRDFLDSQYPLNNVLYNPSEALSQVVCSKECFLTNH